MAVQLQDLRTRVRYRANMENSEFITDTELNTFINESYKELYDILVSKFEDWYVSDPTQFTLTSGDSGKQALASDFYKLRGVDEYISGAWREVKPFNFNERNREGLANRLNGFESAVRYRLVGSDLRFSPVDMAPGTYRYWYTPIATEMSGDTDTMDGVNGWEQYVIVDAARKCLQKEESDTSELERELARLERRIEIMSANRDAANPQQVEDIHEDRNEFPFYRW